VKRVGLRERGREGGAKESEEVRAIDAMEIYL
jgi:hypothetical protein